MTTNKPIYIQALEALRKREGLFRILIFSLVTVVFWIGFSIYLSQQQTKLSIDIRKHTEPLNPNINRETIQEVSDRKTYTPEELSSFPIYERVVNEDGTSQLIIAGTEVIPEPTQAPQVVDEPVFSASDSTSVSPPETTPEATFTETPASSTSSVTQ